MEVPKGWERIARQLALGHPKSVAAAVMSVKESKDATYEQVCTQLTAELVSLCSKSSPSILRKTAQEELLMFSWEKVHDEFKERAPRFLQILTACVSNPSQTRNSTKKGETLIPPMCDAGCKLISIFNEEMNAARRIKSVILKKGGLKKVAFARLSPLYVCMSYKSTNSMFESFGAGFDQPLEMWKSDVEKGVEKEIELMDRLESLMTESADEKLTMEVEEALQKHRAGMHPGFSFTGDNVDMRVSPRQLTLQNRTKDHHMFQLVAFKNRVAGNHLPDTQPKRDISKEPFTTFLPNANEQHKLVEEFIVLIGHKWAKYIPELSWYKDHLPQHIVHEKMDETKKVTEKVSLNLSFI